MHPLTHHRHHQGLDEVIDIGFVNLADCFEPSMVFRAQLEAHVFSFERNFQLLHHAGEISMELMDRKQIGGVSVFLGFEQPKVMYCAVKFDPAPPLLFASFAMAVHALEPGFITFPDGLIAVVFAACTHAQILLCVVQPIAVDMVNIKAIFGTGKQSVKPCVSATNESDCVFVARSLGSDCPNPCADGIQIAGINKQLSFGRVQQARHAQIIETHGLRTRYVFCSCLRSGGGGLRLILLGFGFKIWKRLACNSRIDTISNAGWQFVRPLSDGRWGYADSGCGAGYRSTQEFKCFGFVHALTLAH